MAYATNLTRDSMKESGFLQKTMFSGTQLTLPIYHSVLISRFLEMINMIRKFHEEEMSLLESSISLEEFLDNIQKIFEGLRSQEIAEEEVTYLKVETHPVVGGEQHQKNVEQIMYLQKIPPDITEDVSVTEE